MRRVLITLWWGGDGGGRMGWVLRGNRKLEGRVRGYRASSEELTLRGGGY